jgi:hypothetical protein
MQPSPGAQRATNPEQGGFTMPEDGKSATPTTLEEALEVIKAKDAKIEEWKGHSRTWETRATENKAAADKVPGLEKQLADEEAAKAAGLDENGKRDKRIADLEASLKSEQDGRTAAERAALRTKVAAAKGLPSALAELLVGDDEAAITAHADKLLEIVPKVDPLLEIDTGAGVGGSAIKADAYIAAIDKVLPDKVAATT